ncbi:MAG: ABC transporter ATP-binding protein [Myxococcaceae bacterium]|nr:ABC transporter ATP-binding protein [Myxococcaceae bacterium]MCI0671865.1 ABC transporter ATP-binding protein [Myxococcaceae bacterium]
MPLLRLEGLRKTFRGRVALDGLSLRVEEGEVFGLLGPNGAGKSTAFQLLAGLLKADTGRVYLEGRQVGLDDAALRSRMGVVFQRGSLDEHLTARENLMLGARLYAVPHAQAKVRVEEMLGWMGFSDRADERVAGWSGGMRRRLELARALVHGPRILLLDEPTQGLDEASFRSFWKHLGQLRAAGGLTVLLTSHRADEAALCTRLAVLDKGKLVACDTPDALVSRVGGDIVTVEASAPEEVAAGLSEVLGVSAEVVEGRVVVEAGSGHALIPRLVEAFPAGRLASVSLRRPTLADVFLKLTGHALGADQPAEPPATRRRR